MPDVEEEPVERDEHFEAFDDRYDVYDWSCKFVPRGKCPLYVD